MKELIFIGNSINDLRDFPDEVRRKAGFELHALQCGNMPSDWKVLSNVGVGIYEVRIKTNGQWRVVYVSKFVKAICILHAFQKKTQKTSTKDIEIVKRRYKVIGV